tara:strand:- start:2023 stop:2346 length:324 start_codon:yes stop_codon:yes gene_type:complete
MNKIKFFLIAIIFLLNSCQGVKDALEGKRRSKTGDEFLIEKKNPLALPPNFEDLPEPIDTTEVNKTSESENEDDLQKIIAQSEDSSNQEINNSGSLEDSILQEINRN